MYRLPLYDHRVVDLASGYAAYAGRLLGDMGAEVIKVEPPGGDALRSDADVFRRLNANKYGCVLDVSTAYGRELLLRLTEASDIVIVTAGSFEPEVLAAVKEALIVVALPPDAGVAEGVAAAGAVGLALWSQRRTGRGGLIEVRRMSADAPRAPSDGGQRAREPVMHADGTVAEIETLHWRMSETPAHIRLPPPALGEHTDYVFRKLLGITGGA